MFLAIWTASNGSVSPVRVPPTSSAMGLPLTPAEREEVRRLAGQRASAVDIHKTISAKRARRRMDPPDLTTVRRFLKGNTHRQDKNETRGRKPALSRRNVLKMDKVRKSLIQQSKGEYEVHWADIIKKARVPEADATTAARAFAREGMSVSWRKPREKPLRGKEHVLERKETCRRWRFHTRAYWTDSVDLIIDNTTWNVPATERARKYLNQRKVRGHLRTRGEGLQTAYTKPSGKKHNMNTGGKLKILAGISGCRVALWHYLDGTWNGDAAAQMYKGPIQKILKKKRGEKRRYVVLEDNDPVGYKSGKAIDAKKAVGIEALEFPRYSPDLNPMDYFLWQEVDNRMSKNAPKKLESMDAFKLRLRRTALAIPEAVIRKGVANMKERVADCFKNGGEFITRD